MSAILLVGMADKEAAAIEIMVGMYWREHTCVTLVRSPALSVPLQTAKTRACDVCVVDLFGLGMRKHSEAHEQRLLQCLAGRCAVLLVWGLESGWMERVLPLAAGQQVQYLLTPYSSQSLRETFGKLLEARVAVPEARTPLSMVASTVPARALFSDAPIPPPARTVLAEPLPAWRRAEELAKSLQSARNRMVASSPSPNCVPSAIDVPVRPAPPVPSPAAGHRPGPQTSGLAKTVPPARQQPASAAGFGLGLGAMEALLAMFPALRSEPVVALCAKIVAGQGLQLVSVDPQTEFVLNFRQGWLACGLSLPALQKLARTAHLFDSVRVVRLPEDDAERLVRQRFGGRFRRVQIALDEVAWQLIGDAIHGRTLVPTGDMCIRLRRFPNATALSNVGPLDLQLAAICARAPHHVSDLLRAFPRHPQDVLRFVVLATASGLISVITDHTLNAQAPLPPRVKVPAGYSPPPVAPQPQVRAQQGFFKSFLEKLF